MKKILVIEDDQLVQTNISEILKLEGFTVIEATNGQIGLRIAQTELPDFIISDANMPELDGYGLLTAIRGNAKTKAIPFIFLTARTEKVDMRHGMFLGADDYLTKPLNLNELMPAVTSRLERHDAIKHTVNTQLQELRASISKAVPHELRTPLIGIIGFSKVIKTEYQTLMPKEIGEMAEYIHASAEQLHHLIENYIYYVQLETILTDSNKIHLFRSSVTTDIYDVITSSFFSKAIAVKRVDDLKFEFNNTYLLILYEHLSKMMDELADNALKFSLSETPIHIKSSQTDDSYTLEISNSGRGITKEQIKNFGAFMQFDRSDQEQSGSGMGLAIVQRIVSIYGGEFTIESIPNEITTVSITLPIVSM